MGEAIPSNNRTFVSSGGFLLHKQTDYVFMERIVGALLGDRRERKRKRFYCSYVGTYVFSEGVVIGDSQAIVLQVLYLCNIFINLGTAYYEMQSISAYF